MCRATCTPTPSRSAPTGRGFARLAEILAYAEEVARRHGVDRLVIGNTEVTACRWDGATATWSVETAGGATYEADAIVLATGQLHRPPGRRSPAPSASAGA